MSEIDLTDTIQAKSDQLNASEIAGDMTITVTNVKKVSGDQPIIVSYEGDNGKPWKPCLSMRRLIAHLWGSKVNMIGRQITLVCDPSVTWGGDEVGGIRVKAMSHIDSQKSVPLRASKHKVKKYTVLPIKVKQEAKVDLGSIVKGAEKASLGGASEYREYFTSLSTDEKKALGGKHDDFKNKAQEVDDAKESDDIPSWE